MFTMLPLENKKWSKSIKSGTVHTMVLTMWPFYAGKYLRYVIGIVSSVKKEWQYISMQCIDLISSLFVWRENSDPRYDRINDFRTALGPYFLFSFWISYHIIT